MLTSRQRHVSITLFVVLDVLAVGMGMGVPLFAIGMGFLVGWLLPGFLRLRAPYSAADLRTLLRGALLTSVVTLVIVAMIWLPALQRLRGSAADIANFGIPLILFQPYASLVGWVVLMVFISPALQALTTLFGSVLKCALRSTQQDAPSGP